MNRYRCFSAVITPGGVDGTGYLDSIGPDSKSLKRPSSSKSETLIGDPERVSNT